MGCGYGAVSSLKLLPILPNVSKRERDRGREREREREIIMRGKPVSEVKSRRLKAGPRKKKKTFLKP